MIFPSKGVPASKALITVGGEVLGILGDSSLSVSGLWRQLGEQRKVVENARISYDWFVLSLDLLYLLGAIRVTGRGLIRRSSDVIHELSSTDTRFKTLTFGHGLNILVADQHERATDADTRNGVGKSSFVLLLHFLLGGNAGRDSIFKSETLAESVFTLDFDLGPTRRSVSRSVAPRRAFLVSRDPSEPSDQLFEDGPQTDRLKLTEWRGLLRKELFGLTGPDGPSVRSLLPYFARRVEAGGFDNPFKHNHQQSTANYQIAISFLLDLDWHIAESWDDVRKRGKAVRTLATALQEGDLGSFATGSVAKLRTMVTLAEKRVTNLRRNIDSFRVVDAFTELEREANDLTTTIRQLADDNAIDMALIDQLQLTYKKEVPPDADDLTVMYQAAGVQLGDLVRRRFREVAEFHESVIRNRAHYLQDEVSRAKQRISARNAKQQSLDSRRADLFRVLRSGGALSETYRVARRIRDCASPTRKAPEQLPARRRDRLRKGGRQEGTPESPSTTSRGPARTLLSASGSHWHVRNLLLASVRRTRGKPRDRIVGERADLQDRERGWQEQGNQQHAGLLL